MPDQVLNSRRAWAIMEAPSTQQTLNVIYLSQTVTMTVDSSWLMGKVFGEVTKVLDITEDQSGKLALFSSHQRGSIWLAKEYTVKYFGLLDNVASKYSDNCGY